MPRIHIDVVNSGTLVSDLEALRCVGALRVQLARDFAPVWRRTADLHYVGSPDRAHPGAWQLVLLDDRDADCGYHELSPEGMPLGKVFVREARKCAKGWTTTASHELLELLVNPDTTLGAFVEGHAEGPRMYSYEVCDPCQDDRFAYEIDGVPVSDFVHPAWYEPWRKRDDGPFDQAGHLRRPFEVPRGCYAQFFDVRKKSWRDDWGGRTTPHLHVYGASFDRGGSRRPLLGIPRSDWRKSRR